MRPAGVDESMPSDVDTRAYLGRAREVVAAEVSRLLQLLGSGRERSAAVDTE